MVEFDQLIDARGDHIVSVFTLMLQGKVRAEVRWLCEKSSSHVLKPSDMVDE